MKTVVLTSVMLISITSAFASERPNVFPSDYSFMMPSRLESGICKSAYIIKSPISTINEKMQKCDDLPYFSPEHQVCQDEVYKNLGKLDSATILEISANPTNEAAEDDILKETLKLEIKTKGKVVLERTSIGFFYSSGGEIEGNTIRFEDIMNENAAIIDTNLMNNDYDQSTLTAMLENKGNYYFADCKFQWEATPTEQEEE